MGILGKDCFRLAYFVFKKGTMYMCVGGWWGVKGVVVVRQRIWAMRGGYQNVGCQDSKS